MSSVVGPTVPVSSVAELRTALGSAADGTTILLADGTYSIATPLTVDATNGRELPDRCGHHRHGSVCGNDIAGKPRNPAAPTVGAFEP